MVDIIIPTIDRPFFLNRALNSIQQKCDIAQINIYVIDDGSEYDYTEVLNKYSNLNITYKRVTHRGPGPARNIGIKLGKSEWICFLDSDDIYIDDVTKYCDSDYDWFNSKVKGLKEDYGKINCRSSYGSIHGLGVKREFIEKNNAYFPELQHSGEDTMYRGIVLSLSQNGKIYDTGYYQYMINMESHFFFGKTISNLLDTPQILETENRLNWFSNLTLYLETINVSSEILDSFNWNNQLFNLINTVYNNNKNLLIFSLYAYIVKKYIKSNKCIALAKGKISDLVLLSYINDFVELQDDNLIIKNRDKNTEFLTFYYRYLAFLPRILKHDLNGMVNFYFPIKEIAKYRHKYNYADFDKY